MSPTSILLLVLGLLGSRTQGHRSLLMTGKAWWAKYITQDLYTAGRITPTQIKYAKEVGFKSLVSLQTITTNATIGGHHLPSAEEEREIAGFVNLEYATVLDPGETWKSVVAVQKFAAVYERLPKPMLLHCYIAFSASFVALAHLMNTTDLNIKDVYQQMAVLGYDISKISAAQQVLDEMSRESMTETIPPPDYGLARWHAGYWLMKPLHRGIFIAGQIERHHLDSIIKAGIKTVINNRKGVTTAERPSQEEVSLLNIKDNTRTYTGTGRQSVEELEKNRLNATLANTYISSSSDVNYQMANSDQFGDDIGYNETLESLEFHGRGLSYVHMPIGGELGYTKMMYETYRDDLNRYLEEGPILLHCRSGYRSAVLGLMLVGEREGETSEWALETAAERGIFLESNSKVVQLLRALDDYKELHSASSSVVDIASILHLIFCIIYVSASVSIITG